MYYASHEVFSPFDDGLAVYVFETKKERDWFVANGPRYWWELVYPFEQRAISAREARAVAQTDGDGNKYACLYDGGVIYPWGREEVR